VALGFYGEIVGREISFFELTYYMFPIGTLMIGLLWGFIMIFFKPEKRVIPGLRQRAVMLYENVGPITPREILTLVLVLGIIITLSLRSLIPALKVLDKSGVILVATVLFFMFKILTIDDLEEIPWNIILLFGGAMSLGFCLWETGAASWLAIKWLTLLQDAHWFVFVMGVSIFVLIMTNLIMNVAAIAISIPVALVLAPYIGVSSEVVTFSALVAAGMPFLFLIGAAPNAIAYESRQFTSGQFFMTGVPASILLAVVLGLFLLMGWPLMGMPIAGAPSAVSQSVKVGKDAPAQIILEGSDPDGEPLTFRIIDKPSNGTLSGEGPEVTYTPHEDYTGTDSFTFKTNDGGIDSAAATVTITISGGAAEPRQTPPTRARRPAPVPRTEP
jgi:sodium-dependent dicarboxylate transporter 2/3/5